jgi:2-dehydro-3-deoxyphosphogluconate aldolase / (4S)-4-hydroxy-2-oxoglutarate aldolase
VSPFFELLARDRVLPLLTPAAGADAVEACSRLAAAGIGTLEVALRSPVAVSALAAAVASSPAVLVGAGTVVSPSQVDEVVAAGARFVVTPGFSAAVVERCLAL